jgi:hypothetical protein
MVARLVAALEPAVSKVRLEAYRPTGASDLDMVVNYIRNIELSEALYPCLQSFEIALRNSIHTALSRKFQTEFWFDQKELLLSGQGRAVSGARDELTKHGKPQESGRIVAELNFGFWHSMFNRPYETGLWHAHGAALLVDVFPHLPRTLRTRQSVWNRCDQIRRLRNRVFHYEPIWARPNLAGEHQHVLESLGWINGEMRDTIEMCDRFNDTLRAGRQPVKDRIMDRLSPT